MTTMKNWSDVAAERVERVHPLLELDGAQLLGRALGRLAVEQRLDDAVDEEPRQAQRDERDDDDDQDDGTTLLGRTNGEDVAPGRLVEVGHRRTA